MKIYASDWLTYKNTERHSVCIDSKIKPITKKQLTDLGYSFITCILCYRKADEGISNNPNDDGKIVFIPRETESV